MSRIHQIIFTVMAAVACLDSNAQTKKHALQHISFKALADSIKINPKPILLKIYTNWCPYCRIQDKQITTSDSLKIFITQHFYYVELDAETKNKIVFNGSTYQYKPNGISSGLHELVSLLGTVNGQMAYPAIVIVNSNYKVIFRHQGLLKADELLTVLEYYTQY